MGLPKNFNFTENLEVTAEGKTSTNNVGRLNWIEIIIEERLTREKLNMKGISLDEEGSLKSSKTAKSSGSACTLRCIWLTREKRVTKESAAFHVNIPITLNQIR